MSGGSFSYIVISYFGKKLDYLVCFVSSSTPLYHQDVGANLDLHVSNLELWY